MKMTKREKRLADLRRKIARREKDRELGIKLLVKAVTELPGLRKQEARMLAGWHRKEASPAVVAVPATHPTVHGESTPGAVATSDDLKIPDFLLRQQERSAQAEADVQARAEIKAQQAAEKKRKDARRIEKLKVAQEIKHAELTGQRRKMPLSGRAALDALK
jgi:hypothetical protein